MFVEKMLVSDQVRELIKGLQSASAAKDWTQLELLDKKIKQYIQEAIQSAKTDQEKQQLSLDLKSVQKIYDLVIGDSKENQLEIASELKKLSRDRNAADSYLGVSRF